MRRIFMVAAALAALPVSGGVSRAPAGEADAAVTIDHGGLKRSYLMHVPVKAPPQGGYPVVVILHGGGGQADSMVKLARLDPLADARGFIAVYPNGIGKHWNDGRATVKSKVDDVGFIGAVLDDVGRRHPVDRGRIFVTGMSNGAMMAHRLGCDMSDRIAAVAAVAGMLAADYAAVCDPRHAVALLQISGDADPIVPYGGGKVEDFGGRGQGGIVLSANDSAKFWAEKNRCGTMTVRNNAAATKRAESTSTVATDYRACPLSAPVRLVSVVGGGHSWPGGPQYAPVFLIGKTNRDMDARRTIVEFFLALPRR
jgi:polyhydroxybutyrate depolymerase